MCSLFPKNSTAAVCMDRATKPWKFLKKTCSIFCPWRLSQSSKKNIGVCLDTAERSIFYFIVGWCFFSGYVQGAKPIIINSLPQANKHYMIKWWWTKQNHSTEATNSFVLHDLQLQLEFDFFRKVKHQSLRNFSHFKALLKHKLPLQSLVFVFGETTTFTKTKSESESFFPNTLHSGNLYLWDINWWCLERNNIFCLLPPHPPKNKYTLLRPTWAQNLLLLLLVACYFAANYLTLLPTSVLQQQCNLKRNGSLIQFLSSLQVSSWSPPSQAVPLPTIKA